MSAIQIPLTLIRILQGRVLQAHRYRSWPEAPCALIFLTLSTCRTGWKPSTGSDWYACWQKPLESGLDMADESLLVGGGYI